jgi:hypothetical protein
VRTVTKDGQAAGARRTAAASRPFSFCGIDSRRGIVETNCLCLSGNQSVARTDFAAIGSDLEVIRKQLARLPTRRELAGTALGIIFATMMLDDANLLFSLR